MSPSQQGPSSPFPLQICPLKLRARRLVKEGVETQPQDKEPEEAKMRVRWRGRLNILCPSQHFISG
jgi:hypothetical protein